MATTTSKRIQWDEVGKKFYEAGVSKGVLYPFSDNAYQKGVPWNGLTSVNEGADGGDATNLYADNIKYLSLRSAENFKPTIEAYTYPNEFSECDGSKEIAPGLYVTQQDRQMFGFSYVTNIGSDTKGADAGYKIHLVYGCTASPSEKNRETINDSPDAAQFSWECESTPVIVPGCKPSAHLIIDSRTATEQQMKAIEDKLYGTETSEPTLIMPEEVIEIFKPQG